MSPVIIGDATLYHGDLIDVLPTLARVDVVIADPPYGIGAGRKSFRGGNRVINGRPIVSPDYGDEPWDDAPLSTEHITAILNSAGKAIIWGGNFYTLSPSEKWLVWDKQNSGDFADCELAWTNLPGAVRVFRHMWNGLLRASERDTSRVHPTQKPIALMRWCLQQCGEVSSVVDPCMGSAPVGIACVELGIRYIGIETNERHFRVACERIDNAQRQQRMFETTESAASEQAQLFVA